MKKMYIIVGVALFILSTSLTSAESTSNNLINSAKCPNGWKMLFEAKASADTGYFPNANVTKGNIGSLASFINSGCEFRLHYRLVNGSLRSRQNKIYNCMVVDSDNETNPYFRCFSPVMYSEDGINGEQVTLSQSDGKVITITASYFSDPKRPFTDPFSYAGSEGVVHVYVKK